MDAEAGILRKNHDFFSNFRGGYGSVGHGCLVPVTAMNQEKTQDQRPIFEILGTFREILTGHSQKPLLLRQ